MNRSFWKKTAGVTAAVACTAVLMFTVCSNDEGGGGGGVVTEKTCDEDPTQAKCQQTDPCNVSTNVPAACPVCAVASPPPQCQNYVPPTDPCLGPNPPASCGGGGTPRYCYWAPNEYNDFKAACAEIGGTYCTEESCATEAGCTGSDGVIKLTSDCDGLLGGLSGVTTGTDANKSCKKDGVDLYCQYATGCYAVSEVYSEPAGLTCQQYADACYRDGTPYTGVTNVGPDNNYGSGVTCNGTAVN